MISDRIYDSRFLGSRDILIPVTAVFGCGFDFREVDGLVGIFDVRMYRYFVIFKVIVSNATSVFRKVQRHQR